MTFASLRTIVYGVIILATPLLGLLLEEALDEGVGSWARWAIAGLVALAFGQATYALKPRRKPEFHSLPDANRLPLVASSQWSGELPFDATAVRTALLSCDWKNYAWIVIVRPNGDKLQAEREEKGWRFARRTNGVDRNITVVRAGAGIGYRQPPPAWNVFAPEPGDLFSFEEAESILAAYGVGNPIPSFAAWQRIEARDRNSHNRPLR